MAVVFDAIFLQTRRIDSSGAALTHCKYPTMTNRDNGTSFAKGIV
jgi:hypothetical protein